MYKEKKTTAKDKLFFYEAVIGRGVVIFMLEVHFFYWLPGIWSLFISLLYFSFSVLLQIFMSLALFCRDNSVGVSLLLISCRKSDAELNIFL